VGLLPVHGIHGASRFDECGFFLVSEDQTSRTSPLDKVSGSLSPSDKADEVTNTPTASQNPSPVVPSPDAQKTVISKRAPASAPAPDRAVSPFELGEVLEGQQLGHFQLEEFVGGGGMGAVFRATDTMLGRTVAVKVVSGERTDEETLKRFRNEAQSAARLDHPNIARVYYVGEDEGWNYIVFEFIEGINIRDLVDQQGPLSVEDTVSYTLQIAEALDHAWQRDVIHRDIKPSNILVLSDGRAKLVDMGLARFQQVESSSEDLTASGVTLGTFDYISPEQARDPRNTDVRSDLYSLGCTMFYMLTGQPPFPNGTVLQKLLSHSSDEPPDVHELRPDIGDEVADIIDKLLAKSPEERFQSPSELIGQLILAADHLGLSNVSAGSTVWITPQQQTTSLLERHLPWVAPVVTLIVAVVLIELLTGSVNPVDLAPLRFSGGVFQPSGMKSTSNSAVSSAQELPQPSQDAMEDSVRQPSGDEPAKAAQETGIEQPEDQNSSGGDTETVPSSTSNDGTVTAPFELDSSSASPNVTGDGGIPPDTIASGRPAAETALILEEGPRFIVVSDEAVDLDAKSLRVESIHAALQTAAALSSVEEIELRFDGTRLLRPIELRLDNSPNRNVLIRAANGYNPQLAFDPTADASWPKRATTMFQLHGGQLTWSDVHFFLRVPTPKEPSEAWALFGLHAVSLLEFRHCTLTLEHLGDDELPVTATAAFVRVPSFSAPTPTESDDGLAKVKVWMEHCIARGQATLVHVEDATPIQLFWHHGAFFSTERLIVIEGSEQEDVARRGRSNLDLQRVFTATAKGIGLLDANSSTPYSSGLATNCFDCLFASQTRSTSPAPVFQIRGQASEERPSAPLEVNGSNNFYRGYSVFADFIPLRVGDEERTFTFEDVEDPTAAAWFHERNPQPATAFSWPDPKTPVHAQTLDDYIDQASDKEAFTYTLGFEPTQLPTLPATNVSSLERSFDWDPGDR
jgi:serine/threonine protein kinase